MTLSSAACPSIASHPDTFRSDVVVAEWYAPIFTALLAEFRATGPIMLTDDED